MHDLIDLHAHWLVGAGEMAERIRAYDWRATPLGSLERWPPSLRMAVNMMLASRDPVAILWGPERVQLYNDAYLPIAGERHPEALGRAAAQNWSEAYADFLGPVFERVFAGETVCVDEHRVELRTADGSVDRFFTGQFLPIRDETGAVAGVFHPLTEVTARVRADAALRERERRLKSVLAGMGEGFGLLAPDFTILEHNDEALRMDGRPREQIVGRSHWEVFPGSEDSELGRLLREAMAERKRVALEHCYAWENGRPRWLEMRAYPSVDGTLAVFWRDITDRKATEAALRAERDRTAEILESISDAFYAVDAQWRFTYVNRKAEAWWGRRREDLIGKVFWEEFPQLVGSEPYEAHMRAAETRALVRLETVSPLLREWVDISIYPTGDGGLSVYFRDIGEKKRAEARLRASEARFADIFSQVTVGIAQTDLTGRFVMINDRQCEILGRPREELLEMTMQEVTHPDDLPGNMQLFQRLATTGEPFVIEKRYVRPDGAEVWVRNNVSTQRGPDGRPEYITAVVVDVTEAKLAEARQQLLINELNHRVKNTLATVQSLAAQAARSEDPRRGHTEFLDRLMALSRAHDVLTREHWDGAELADVARAALAPFEGHASDRFALQGPPVRLNPQEALALSMGLHELATNAVKYGALSAAGGRVALDWSAEPAGAPAERCRLKLVWREQGGPAVAPPSRQGFGSRLMRGLAQELGGTASAQWEPDGVTWRIDGWIRNPCPPVAAAGRGRRRPRATD